MTQSARPLTELPPSALRSVRGVMTDIDDTLTRAGAIEPAALEALHRLAAAGVPVVAITGRPMGWSLPFASAWPVMAIVAENGAVALIREGTGLTVEYAQDESTRAINSARLQAVAAQVLREVPGAVLAQDSAGRVTDIAIDHSEFAHLPQSRIDQAVALMRGHGMKATVSSIHINGWYGDHSKFTAADWMLRRLFGRSLQSEIEQWIYVGDSTNDQLMFEHFPLSVGVANLRDFAASLKVWPRYIAQRERGAGFAELANLLLAARAQTAGAGALLR